MSQEKAQLIAPQGHFTVPGLNVAGVVTASSFSGNCTGTASSIVQGTNVVVGVMTASSFAGDVFGNAAGLSTTTAGLKLGIVTATSFGGNFTGIGSGLTGTPNIVAGLVTASQFVGNTPGLAAGISAGKNLAAGIITATTFYGDGSALTGAGSTAYIRQTVGSGTTIDLNNGNIILFEHVGDTTVSFANTSTADDVTFIRSLDPTDISISTGGITFDGTGDYLSMANSTDFDFGSGDFTIEAFIYHTSDAGSGANAHAIASKWDNQNNDKGWYFRIEDSSGDKLSFLWTNDGSTNEEVLGSTIISLNRWYHTAVTRSGNTISLFLDGVLENTYTETGSLVTATIEQLVGAAYATGSIDNEFAGKISNVRIIKGRALYTTGFYPPSAELTNVADTKLLCCQSDSSTTVGAVKPGTITAGGDPAAGAQTITLSPTLGSAITWPTGVKWNDGSAPTLLGANSYSKTGQVFNLVTADGGSTWYGYEEVSNTAVQPHTLFGWGDNTYGYLAQNNRTQYSSPVQIPGTTWRSLTSSSYNAQGGTKTDNTLWMWGRNNYGQLGQNSTVQYSSPVQVSGTTWSSVVSSNYYSNSSIKTDGTLWTWGRNQYGKLGHNQTHDSSISSPVQVPGTTWSKVTIGYMSTAAIKTDGTLWVMGRNNQGVLGQNDKTDRSSPVQITGTTWNQISRSPYSSFAIKTDGTLWSWGRNVAGELGLNQAGGFSDGRSSPVQIPGTTWSEVSSGSDRANYAVKTDGTLWSWGYGLMGSLAQNNTTSYSSPVQIPGTTWSSVAGGSNGAYATKTDGTLWAWGNKNAGMLGQNSVAYYSSPVQIPGTNWSTMSGGTSNVLVLSSYNP